MFPTNGSEIVGVTADVGEKLTGGIHGVACTGGGAEIAGGGVHVGLTCAGGVCAEIAVAAVDEVAKDDDAAGPGIVGGCHLPGPNFFALRDSSSALTPPYTRQPTTMQISAPSKAISKSNPSPRIAV